VDASEVLAMISAFSFIFVGLRSVLLFVERFRHALFTFCEIFHISLTDYCHLYLAQ